MSARQTIGVLLLVIVTTAVHGGVMDGLEAHSAAEAGFDDRTRGLMEFQFRVGTDAEEPAFKDEAVQRRAEVFDVGPEAEGGPPGLAVTMFTTTLDLYDAVALYSYKNRGWLSVTLVDTALLTLNALSVAVMAFQYRHVPRNIRRTMR